MMRKKAKPGLIHILILPAMIVLMMILWAAGLKDYLSLDAVQSFGADFKSFIANHFILGTLAYAAFYIVIVISCLPAVAIASLMAGFLFGLVWGCVLAVLSATTGAVILFLIARSSLCEVLREKAGKFYTKAAQQMNQGAISYMLFMRLVPGMPFSISNIVPALLNVPLRLFVITTIIGILPSVFVLVNLGQTLGQIHSMSDLLSTQTLAALGLLAILALIPAMIKARKNSSDPS